MDTKFCLVLSSKPPYPLRDGAAIRTFQSVCILAELGYKVDVLYLSEENDVLEVRRGLDAYCHEVNCVVLPKWKSYLKVMWGLLTNRLPLQVNYFLSGRARRWILKHQDRYEMVYCNNIRTALWAKGLKAEKIIDYVDAYSMNYQSARDNSRGIWHWIYTLDYPRCNKFEQKILHAFDKRLIISHTDKEYILSHAKEAAPISVIENFTHIDDTKRVTHDEQSHKLVFVGAMNYEPNVSAVKYFCKWVLPPLVERYPDICFYIVGKTPTPQVQALAGRHVVVTGFVKDIWDYLKDAAVVVTPMQTGSGLQNKILQALAVGACVVTTPKGFEGLVSDEGQPIVAHNSLEMVQAISHLIDHSKEREQMGQKAVEYVKKHYAKDVIKEKFAQFLYSDTPAPAQNSSSL